MKSVIELPKSAKWNSRGQPIKTEKVIEYNCVSSILQIIFNNVNGASVTVYENGKKIYSHSWGAVSGGIKLTNICGNVKIHVSGWRGDSITVIANRITKFSIISKKPVTVLLESDSPLWAKIYVDGKSSRPFILSGKKVFRYNLKSGKHEICVCAGFNCRG